MLKFFELHFNVTIESCCVGGLGVGVFLLKREKKRPATSKCQTRRG